MKRLLCLRPFASAMSNVTLHEGPVFISDHLPEGLSFFARSVPARHLPAIALAQARQAGREASAEADGSRDRAKQKIVSVLSVPLW
jgi:hypothetical protein